MSETAPVRTLRIPGRLIRMVRLIALAASLAALPALTVGTSTASAATAPGAVFVPLGPVRIVDSRIGLGISGALAPNVPAIFAVAGVAGIPAGALAVSGNLTVDGQNHGGYVSLTPEPVSAPPTSTLNTPFGDTRANGVIAPLGTGGHLSATAVGMSTHVIFDVTGYFLPSATAGASWSPLVPARILDTRYGVGLGGRFAPGVARTFAVAGRGGVPADAVAVTANVTVTAQTGSGYVSITTDPQAAPTTSTVNFPLADNRGNNLIARLGTGGTLSATYRGYGSTDLLLDVTGYFRAGSDGALFVPLTPARVLDSRTGQGLAGPFSNAAPRSLGIAGTVGVPSGALAVTGNLTATETQGRGFAAVTPEATASPPTSTLNYPAADIRANGFVTVLDSTGRAAFVVLGATTQLVADVTGYLVGPRPAAASAAFITPAPGALIQVTGSTGTVDWTESGTVSNRALTESVALATSPDCSGVNWTPGDSVTPTGSSVALSGLAPGTCYRFSLTLNGDASTTITSGILRTPPPPFYGTQLYRASAFSQQATSTWCTAASTQMMLNLITGASDHSSTNQSTYMAYAVAHSQYVAQGGGAEIDGWANALTHFGAGTYSARALPTFAAAVKEAATRMRITGKPIGLVVMEGHHAWVMAGFTSTGGDPATTQNFSVTGVTVMAPDYPLIAYDPAPGTTLTLASLSTKLTPYTDDFPTIWDGGYAIIEP